MFIIPSQTPCKFFNESGSRYLFATREGELDCDLEISEYGQYSGIFINKSIARQIKRHSRESSDTNAKYYPYQKKLSEQYPELLATVKNGSTIYWRRKAPEYRMELIVVDNKSVLELKK